MARIAFQGAYGQGWSKNAEAPLGQPINAGGGDYYRSIKVGEAWDAGMVLRDAKHTDIVNATETEGTATAAQAVGSRELADTGNFTNKKGIIEGAIGQITGAAAADGWGQIFVVDEWLSNDKVAITVIATLTKPVAGPGWQSALRTTSTYRLAMPGLAFKFDTVATDLPIGVAQAAAASGDVGSYGQAQVCGVGLALNDVSGVALAQGHLLVPTTDAKVAGAPATVTAVANKNQIGHSLCGDTDASADGLIPVMFTMPLYARGLRATDPVAENNN